MSAEDVFGALRAYKRELVGEGLTQDETDAFNAIFATWTPARAAPNPTALSDAQAFFKVVRERFGHLKQEQVDGFNALLQAMGAATWPIAWTAYGLATAWHETAHTMRPVEEAFWKDDAWRKKNLSRYYPWHGRGYVQLTWEANYKKADEVCGLNGALMANRDLAMRPDIAAKILVNGMQTGWFTTKKNADFLPAHGSASAAQYQQARRIINGTDKAIAIATQAQAFEAALSAGGWA